MNNFSTDPTFPAMAMDIFTNILQLSDDLHKLSDYLSEFIREMTGAKLVAVIQHHAGKETSRILSVNPERRKNILDSKEFTELIEIGKNINAFTLLTGFSVLYYHASLFGKRTRGNNLYGRH
jgi:hypothetical protein